MSLSILRLAAREKDSRQVRRRTGWDRRWNWISTLAYTFNALIFSRAWFQPAEATRFSARDPAHFDRLPWTRPILVIGDNQIHHEFGEPDSVSNMLDRWSEPSVRPPLTMLFGHVLLERELERNDASPERRPILHTGDAINISCRTEFERFRGVMLRHFALSRGGPAPFVMMPGNHDGFFMGNFQAGLSSVFTGQSGFAKLCRALFNSQGIEWRCRGADTFGTLPIEAGPFSKNDFILGYLGLLHQNLRARLGSSCLVPQRFRSGTAGETVRLYGQVKDDFLVGAAFYIDPQAPQRSFIVQLIRLPPGKEGAAPPPAVYMLLLDSANYRRPPRAAGMQGAFTDRQMQAAFDLWVNAGAPKDSHLLFAFHHNVAALARPSRRKLARLAADLRNLDGKVVVPACITAHRHRGGWYAQTTRTGLFWGGKVTWTDLNVSSMVDWPLGRRQFALWGPKADANDGDRVVAARKPLVLVSAQELLFQRGQLDLNVQGGLARSVAEAVLNGRRSPLRRNPLIRMVSILLDPLRDRYVAEYAILHEMARSLCAVIDDFATRYPALVPAQVQGALEKALATDPLVYEEGFRGSGRPIALFEDLRRAVHDGWQWVDAACGAHPALRESLAIAIAAGAAEDYHGQWRAWGALPIPVANRWYRTGATIDERYALVSALREAT